MINLLAERRIEVDHVTVYRWVQRLSAKFIDSARSARHATGDRWFLDETYVKVASRWTYLERGAKLLLPAGCPRPKSSISR